jgi:hypothetical protein
MDEYTHIVDNIFKLSNKVLYVTIVDLFGEIVYSRIGDSNSIKTKPEYDSVEKFQHLVDNYVYLNLEKFVFTIFNENGFKTIVLNLGKNSLFIILQKTLENTQLLPLLTYLFDSLLDDVNIYN